MDGESGSEVVSCRRLVFCRVLSEVFWFQKDRFARLGKWQFVFNSGADCIHKCHQGVELGVEAQENEKNVINEAFPKLD